MRSDLNNSMVRWGFLSVPALTLLAACTAGNGKGLDQNGSPLAGAGSEASDFQEIQDTIFTPICTQCHIGASAPQGLRLDAANSYALLVNVPSNEVPGLMRVNPGNPDASYIVQKLEGTAAQGARMPFGGPYLTQDRIDLVRRWIAAGAPNLLVAPGKLTVTSTVPGSAETAAPGTDKITVVFAHDVDANLAASGTFALVDGTDAPVAISSAVVPTGRPNVVELNLARPLVGGSYQLRVSGSGAISLADVSGHVLDGDADGQPGGDFLMSFDVGTGDHP